MPLRVLIDSTAVPTNRGGVGRYVDGLVHALDEIGADLAVACQQRDEQVYGDLAPQARVVPAPSWVAQRGARLGWEQVGLPGIARRVAADVVHSPHYTMPLTERRPVVVTLHDATFFSDPGVHSAVKARFFRTWTRVSLGRAARCIVPSYATRDELVRLARADPTRIDVAHHGVDHERFRPPTAAETGAMRHRLGLGERPYVAFLGTIEPRKNVPGLIRGWASAVMGMPEPPALVVAGGPGWDDGVDAAAATVPPGLELIRPGYLPLDDLSAYLGGATIVVYPSLGEGFGLPVLEAMACGAAVLTTRRLALPEAGGDAVAYTEPDADSIAKALRELLGDEPRRAALSAAATARAAGFTWKDSARTHLDAYEGAAASRLG